jgi:hypothetical protein
MIQIPVNLAQRILDAAQIAAAMHQEQSFEDALETEGAGRAPQAERLNILDSFSN